MYGRKLTVISLLMVGIIAGKKTSACPEPWTGRWGKKFKKSFRDFHKFPNHKGSDCISYETLYKESYCMTHINAEFVL